MGLYGYPNEDGFDGLAAVPSGPQWGTWISHQIWHTLYHTYIIGYMYNISPTNMVAYSWIMKPKCFYWGCSQINPPWRLGRHSFPAEKRPRTYIKNSRPTPWLSYQNPWRIHLCAAIYGAPWIPSIYPLYVCSHIYKRTMDPSREMPGTAPMHPFQVTEILWP